MIRERPRRLPTPAAKPHPRKSEFVGLPHVIQTVYFLKIYGLAGPESRGLFPKLLRHAILVCLEMQSGHPPGAFKTLRGWSLSLGLHPGLVPAGHRPVAALVHVLFPVPITLHLAARPLNAPRSTQPQSGWMRPTRLWGPFLPAPHTPTSLISISFSSTLPGSSV